MAAKTAKALNTTMDSMATLNTQVQVFWRERKVSKLTWVAFFTHTIANLINLVVFVAPGWSWTLEISGRDSLYGEFYGHYGVWWACWRLTNGQGMVTCRILTDVASFGLSPWYKAVQALATLVVIFGFASFLLLGCYMWIKTLNSNTRTMIAFIVVTIIGGLTSVAMFVTFCVQFLHTTYWCCAPVTERQVVTWHLWYCFILACVQTGFYLVSVIAAIFEVATVAKEYARYKRMEEAAKEAAQESFLTQQAMWPLTGPGFPGYNPYTGVYDGYNNPYPMQPGYYGGGYVNPQYGYDPGAQQAQSNAQPLSPVSPTSNEQQFLLYPQEHMVPQKKSTLHPKN